MCVYLSAADEFGAQCPTAVAAQSRMLGIRDTITQIDSTRPPVKACPPREDMGTEDKRPTLQKGFSSHILTVVIMSPFETFSENPYLL